MGIFLTKEQVRKHTTGKTLLDLAREIEQGHQTAITRITTELDQIPEKIEVEFVPEHGQIGVTYDADCKIPVTQYCAAFLTNSTTVAGALENCVNHHVLCQLAKLPVWNIRNNSGKDGTESELPYESRRVG